MENLALTPIFAAAKASKALASHLHGEVGEWLKPVVC
jgi:hypothetical protein